MPDKPRPKHRRPSKAEMEERVSVPLDPEELVEGILQVQPETEDEEKKARADERENS